MIAVLGLAFFRSTVVSVVREMQAQPGEAASIAQDIADFTLPEGYTSAVVTRFARVEVVA